ncbi:hypothetical protein ABH15_02655 [Methanoculleus taiwanensis]|uniref:Uncharacterized protein n=1 Tax=Methanoculleus taiwanensis TaxID=1550565 RepID=A0A498H538_9EURY|nr:hypothetical protein [Methanoculleus taiwanensis]RXE57050.1 hypothetical protein ABH15_02655 [Methanoculleus taiwanensis]
MSEKKGHFEKGRWVEDNAPVSVPESAPAVPTGERRTNEASHAVQMAVEGMVSSGQHLPGTPEGHDHIEQAARIAAENLERAINEWSLSARLALRRF